MAKSRILQNVLANATASHHRHTEKSSNIPLYFKSLVIHSCRVFFFAETAGDFMIKYHKTFISAESASAQCSAISALAQSIRSLYNYSNEQGRTLKPLYEATDTHKICDTLLKSLTCKKMFLPTDISSLVFQHSRPGY